MPVDAVAKAGKTFAKRDALPDQRRDVAVDQCLEELRRQHAGTAVFRTLQRHQAGNDGVEQVQPGRCRASHGKGRGVQFMIRQQHQRAADQIGGVLVGRRPRSWRSADAAAPPMAVR